MGKSDKGWKGLPWMKNFCWKNVLQKLASYFGLHLGGCRLRNFEISPKEMLNLWHKKISQRG